MKSNRPTLCCVVLYCSRAHHRDDDEDYDNGMLGFSAGECEELLCQGIKPWDDEAGAALMILNGYDDY